MKKRLDQINKGDTVVLTRHMINDDFDYSQVTAKVSFILDYVEYIGTFGSKLCCLITDAGSTKYMGAATELEVIENVR